MSTPQFKLIFRVPPSHLEMCKTAVFSAAQGNTRAACTKSAGSTPHIGQPGVLERVEEYQVETLCVGEEVMRNAVKALRKAHPYEQVVVEVVQLVDIGDIDRR
ncbi:hypothetical protein N7526_002671 [Penicillium atrosanguineum]|nr:hypothetical protein N7526_002671 [Penicillium atrosanguineum]